MSFSSWRPKGSWWWNSQYFLRNRWNKSQRFQEFSNELTMQAGRQVTDHLRLGGQFHFLGLTSDTAGITLSPTNHDNVPGLGVVLAFDTRDSASNARRGWWNSVDTTKNGFGGAANFWTSNFDVRRYQPISGRHGLAMFSLLALQSGTVGQRIPSYDEFYIGGTNTVRGWEINARNGKNQWLNILEYRYELVKPRTHTIKGLNFYCGVQLAAFADAGSAWNTRSEFSPNFIAGGGFGIRLIVPYVNLIRLDFAFGQPGNGLIPQIGILEKPVYERRRVR